MRFAYIANPIMLACLMPVREEVIFRQEQDENPDALVVTFSSDNFYSSVHIDDPKYVPLIHFRFCQAVAPWVILGRWYYLINDMVYERMPGPKNLGKGLSHVVNGKLRHVVIPKGPVPDAIKPEIASFVHDIFS